MLALRTGFIVVALLTVGAVATSATRREAVSEPAPYARWRNGVIVSVRNCSTPASEQALLQCAALICAQRVTERLTNPQQTKLALTAYTRAADGRQIEVHGTLGQQLRAPTLPTGFSCSMANYRRAEPVFEFARRSTAGAGAAGIDFARPQ